VPAGARADVGLSNAVVAGLPLVRRIALAGGRAGFGRILAAHGLDADGTLPGIPADPSHHTLSGSPCRVVLLAANVIPQPDWLRSLLSMPIEPDRLYVDGETAALIETARSGEVLSAAAGSRSVGDLGRALRARFPEVPWQGDRTGRFPLAGPGDVPWAETWLLRSLIKASEGVMSRHFERRLSLALTRRLVRTGITPNTMTVASVAIGLLGAPCFLSADARVQVLGALLFLAHSILDGCDGELARLQFLESRSGALLDFWGDNLVHVAVFLAMAVGWTHAVGAPWPLAVGAMAIAGTIAAAALLGAHGFSQRPRAGDPSWVTRLTGALAHRDFIYLIIVLAAAGKAWWFLALAAVGTPIFALLCLVARATRRGA
jgi:phosphatidylglycerophosphate synthase